MKESSDKRDYIKNNNELRRVNDMMRKKCERKAAHNWILAEALLELRELATSGSAEMAIIDDALGKANIYPWKRNPECNGRGNVCMDHEECGHCRQALCGMIERDGNCEICIKCSLHCECGTFDGNDDE